MWLSKRTVGRVMPAQLPEREDRHDRDRGLITTSLPSRTKYRIRCRCGSEFYGRNEYEAETEWAAHREGAS